MVGHGAVFFVEPESLGELNRYVSHQPDAGSFECLVRSLRRRLPGRRDAEEVLEFARGL